MKVSNRQEMEEFATRFAIGGMPHANGAVLITLSGDLGAGKTTFVQAFGKALGVGEDITSPTFVIEKIYHLPAKAGLNGQKFQRLIHIDAYRLESSHELETLGFKELLEDRGNLILLEWPEKVQDLIPEDAISIRFDIHGDERTISINGEKEDGKR